MTAQLRITPIARWTSCQMAMLPCVLRSWSVSLYLQSGAETPWQPSMRAVGSHSWRGMQWLATRQRDRALETALSLVDLGDVLQEVWSAGRCPSGV